jgi:hypothetical protein
MEPRLFRPVTLRRHLSMALPLSDNRGKNYCGGRARARVTGLSDPAKNVTLVAVFRDAHLVKHERPRQKDPLGVPVITRTLARAKLEL